MWQAVKTENASCGGYTTINKTTTKPSTASSNGVTSAIQIRGRNAVVQDSVVTHYGTCGSNVAFALQVASAHGVVIRRNTFHYGCAAYGFAAMRNLVFEDNQLIPYKNASGGGSNVDTFGMRVEMSRMFYANNTQILCVAGHYCPPSHLETMTLDAGTGLYFGHAAVSTDGTTVTLASQPTYSGTSVFMA